MVLSKLLARSDWLDKEEKISSGQTMIVSSVLIFLSDRYPPALEVYHQHPGFP